MKASSVGVEFFVKLNDEEIKILGERSLEGVIQIRNLDKIIGIFPLDLRVGKININQDYIEVRTVPENIYFEDASRFIFILSKEGYENLKQFGLVGDRMNNNPGCKVRIKSETYRDY